MIHSKCNAMHSKSDNIEIMVNDEVDEVIKNCLNQSKRYIKISCKKQSKVVSLPPIMFIYCIINVIK